MTNDWIVANLNNPDFTVSDFQNIADMSTSNTQMLSKDQYLKSDFIKNNDAFKDDQGRFSQKKFDSFYNNAAKSFQDFRTNNSTDGLEYDVFDIRRTPNSKVKKDNLNISKNLNNPDRQQIGIEGVNIWSDPELSRAEIAQSQQIFDTATGKFKDYTPQDQALFNGKTDFGISWIKSLFSDPLVLATYDKDEVDKYGKKHYKGEYKLNDNGTYYYETLNGRSPIGKEVLSSLDNLTREGTTINKYDFFDSDDIEKSVTGTVAKNVASLVPIFIGGPVGVAYSSLIIAREMAKSMPMLYSMSSSLLGDYDVPAWMNSVAAMGNKFTSGTSQYAKEHTFAFENFGNLVADVALQWGQQKTIAQAFNKVKNSQNLVQDAYKNAQALYIAKASQPEWIMQAGNPAKWTESALGQACIKKFVPAAEKAMVQQSQLGRDASLMYMSIISNSDVYNDAIDKGATKQEAAAVALGSTLGMFAVDKYAHLGEVFFDDATEESVKAARRAIKKELIGDNSTKGLQEILTKGIINNPEVAQNGAKRYLTIINNSANKIKNLFKDFNEDLKYHTLGFLGKAAGEGTEEVAEELVTDTAKSIYQLAGALGANTSVKDIGAWDNAFDRYTMSFLGGAVGGGVFYAKESLQNIKSNKQDQEMAALIRNGHAQELRDYVETLRKKGKLGSTNLSGTKYTETTDDDGNITGRTWLTADDISDSQNEIIAKHLNNKITAIEAVINNNEIGLSDDQLFNNMVLQESRYQAYKENAAITGYYDQFNDIFSDITKAQADYDTASGTVDGTVNGKVIPNDNYLHGLSPEQQATRTENLEKLKQKLEDARAKKDQFLSGDVSVDYIRKLNFAMDKALHSQFMAIDEDQIWNEMFPGKKKSDASANEIEQYKEQLSKQQNFSSKEELTQAWNRFKDIEETLKPSLHNLGEESEEYVNQFQQLEKALADIRNIQRNLKGWNDKLDTESDEDFNNRDNKLTIDGVEELDEDFQNRRNTRIKALNDYNESKDAEWANNIENILSKINYQVDPITAQQLKRTIYIRIKDIIRSKSSQYPELGNSLDQLNPDLSNVDEIKNQLKTLQNTKTTKLLYDVIDNLKDSDKYTTVEGDSVSIFDALNDGNDYTFADLDDPNMVLDTLQQLLPPEQVTTAMNYLNQIRPYAAEDMSIIDFLESPSFTVNDDLKTEVFVDAAVSDISNNHIYKLHQKIKTSLKNPILELTKELTGKILDNKRQNDVAKMLDIIQNNFDTLDSIQDLQLDAEQMKTLITAKDALKLISTYIYAASSEPNSLYTIGHNKVINQYIQNHKDKIQNTELLPEIDTKYGVIFQSSVEQFIDNINDWIKLSNENSVNKKKQFYETDKALTRSFLGVWNQNQFKYIINGHTYNLLDGFKDDENDNVRLFNYEKVFFKNVQNILNTEGISIKEFLEQTKFLDNFIEYNNLEKQEVSRLSPQLQYKNLTSYDKLIYLSTVLALNPSDFYSFIKTEVNNNDTQAPISSQEYGIRVGIAQFSDTFKSIMQYAFDKSGSKMHNNLHTIVITGDAGAGKTSVLVKGITKFYSDQSVYCAGPTMQQAHGLFKSLDKGKEIEVKELLKQILGQQQYTEIEEDLNTKILNNTLEKESKYFHVYNDNDYITAVIHPENITFNKLEDSPQILVIDEATHIPSIYLQMLDEYMKQTGGQLIIIGDRKQRGYNNINNEIANMEPLDFFATRTPELNVSLRDNNIQKSNNIQQVRALLSNSLNNFDNMSKQDWDNYLNTLKNLISKIQFHYYNTDQLTGDLITNTIDQDTLSKIKGTIGFIGSEDSAYYKQLVNAGLKPKLLSMNEMQGQEFDYVIIDQKLNLGKQYQQVQFLQDLYTLMSRGRTASIFIDNGLSSIIKPSSEDDYTAKAPSLADKVNGISIIDELRKEKLETLSKFDLSEASESNSVNTNGESNNENSDKEVSPTDFKAPEEIKNPKEDEVEKAIEHTTTPMSSEESIDLMDSEFNVLAYSDVTLLGVNTEDSEEISSKNNKKYKGKRWIINHDTTRRNISALTDKDSVFWYKDKLELQKLLYKVKSALIYQHSFNETSVDGRTFILPTEIRSRFNEKDWNNGTYEIEFRPIDNEVQAIGSSMSNIGMDYEGSKFIANIVFKVKDKNGNICIFDLAGINNPDTFTTQLPDIKKNLQKRIDKETNIERKTKLQNTLDNIEDSRDKYTNLFDSWLSQYKRYGKFSLNVSDAIVVNGLTSFVKRKGPALRLDGYIDPTNVDKPNTKNFKNLNPGYVISDVYTYACDNPDLMKIDPSVKGRAVVFVSGDTLLNPEDLINIYIQQKTHPENHTPTVRMIKLNNYGLRFSQLYDDKLLGNIYKKDGQSLPFRANYHGIQMFVSMWNWRAALINFNSALNQWMANNHYDFNKVDLLTKVEHEIYENPDQKDSILSSNHLIQADLDNLSKFNLEICKEIPIFRLGYSSKNDFHIQRFNVEGSSAYKNKKEANLIVITPKKAQQFNKLVNRVIQTIVPSNVGLPTLNLELKKSDNSKWENNEYIDINEAKHQRTLSGLFKQDLAIEDKDGKTLVYKDGIQWSLIPKLIDRFVKNATFYQNNPDQLSGDYGEQVNLVVDKGKDTEHTIQLQFGDLIADHILLDNDTNGGKFDSTLYDMFDLMFHGTTDDIHRKSTKDNPLVQADDARFPRGFLINPDITRKKGTNSSDIAIGYKGEVTYYPIETPGEFFTVDVDMRNMGLSLSLSKLLNSMSKEETILVNPTATPTTTVEESTIQPTTTVAPSTPPTVPPEIAQFYDDNGFDEDMDLEDAIDKANERIKGNLTNIVATSTNPKNIIIKYYSPKANKLESNKLGEFIERELGTQEYEISVTEDNGKQQIQINTSDKTYILNINNYKLEAQSTSNTLSIQQPYKGSTIIDSLMTFVNDNIEELNNTDVDLDTEERLYDNISDNSVLNKFLQDISELQKASSEEEIEQIKSKIAENIDYIGYLGYLEEKDNDLNNLLFGCQ